MTPSYLASFQTRFDSVAQIFETLSGVALCFDILRNTLVLKGNIFHASGIMKFSQTDAIRVSRILWSVH